MSFGNINVTVQSLEVHETYPSLFVSVACGKQVHLTSKLRQCSGGTFDESLSFEFDSDIHDTVLQLEVKTKAGVLSTFEVDALSARGSVKTFSDDKSTLKVLVTYDGEEGVDLGSYNYLFPLSYVVCGLAWLLPQHLPIPYYYNLLVTTSALIYLGSHLSLRLRVEPSPDSEDGAPQGEVMSFSDAVRFPFVGSAALFSLYCAFKYLDPAWVNFIISFYFTAVGACAIGVTFQPVIESVLPPSLNFSYKKTLSMNHPLPEFVCGPSPLKLEIDFSACDLLGLLVGCALAFLYFLNKGWTLNNVLGMCFCIQGISLFSIGSFKVRFN